MANGAETAGQLLPPERERLALVLSGGGNLGVIQVPFLQRLMDEGVRPDLIVGASVGSINGAFLAFHPDNLDGLVDIWLALRNQRLWSRNLLRISRNLIGRRLSLYSNQFLRDLVEPHVTIDEIGAAEIPLFIAATSLTRGRKHVFQRGSVIESVLASAAIPGLFPPVEIDGEWFVDASVATGLDLETAILQGATTILAVDLGAELPPHRPSGLVDVMARSMAIAVEQRTSYEIDHLGSAARTVIWRPGLHASSSSTFTDVEELYQTAREIAPALIGQARQPDGSWRPGVYEGVVPMARH